MFRRLFLLVLVFGSSELLASPAPTPPMTTTTASPGYVFEGRSKYPTRLPTKQQLTTSTPSSSSPTLPTASPTTLPTASPTLKPTYPSPSASPTLSSPTSSPTLREDGVFFTLVFANPNSTLLAVTPAPSKLPTARRRPTSSSTVLKTSAPSSWPTRAPAYDDDDDDDDEEEEDEDESPQYDDDRYRRRRLRLAVHRAAAAARRQLAVVNMPNTDLAAAVLAGDLSPLVDWQRLYQGVHCLMDFLLLANNMAYSQLFISAQPSDVVRCNGNFWNCFPLRIEVFITPVGQIHSENATCVIPACGRECDDSCVLASQFTSFVQPNLNQTLLLLLGSTKAEQLQAGGNNDTSVSEIRNLVYGLRSNELYPSGRFCRDDYLDATQMALILNTLTQSPTAPPFDDQDANSGGPSPGLVAGIALSAFGAMLIAGILLAWFLLRRRSRMQKRKDSDEEYAIDVSRLELGKQIGSGASSRIFMANYEGSLVCIKEMRSGVDVVRLLKREVETLRILKHPHIIQLYGYAVDRNERFLIMMELMDTSLDRVIRDMALASSSSTSSSPAELDVGGVNNARHFAWAMDVARQIALALHFVHSKEVVHCDVKPANVLFKGKTIKLCDLGIAKLVNHHNHNNRTKPENIQGTISYMSPELLLNGPASMSKAIDVYAFAVVVWQIFHLEPSPYPSKLTRREIRDEILAQRKPKLHPELDARVGRLISQSWDQNADLRPTFSEILSQLECICPTFQKSRQEQHQQVLLLSPGSRAAAAARLVWSGSSTPEDGDEDEDEDESKWTSLSDVLTGVVRETKALQQQRRARVAPLDVALSPHHHTSHVDHSFQYDGESFVFSNGLVVHAEGGGGGTGEYASRKIRRISLLGQGASGQVHSGVLEDTWEVVAVKEVSRFFDHQVRAQARKEIEALAMLKHDHIVSLHALYFNASFASMSITLVLEFVLGGSLQRIVDYSRTGMDERSLRVIARDVADALVFCRDRGVVHLDVKPANILVSALGGGRAKLADFGLAKLLLPSSSSATKDAVTSTFLGTALYMSPERARGESYGFPADVWGLGLSLYTAAVGRYPLSEASQSLLLVEFADVKRELAPLPKALSPAFRDFVVSACMEIQPEVRATPAGLRAHVWLEEEEAMPQPAATATAAATQEVVIPMLVLSDFADKLIDGFASLEELKQAKQEQVQNLARQFGLSTAQVLDAFRVAFEQLQQQQPINLV